MIKSVNLKINNCKECPHHTTGRTRGAGYALDYLCMLAPRTSADYKQIVGYVEWPDEEPKDHEIPDWCPLAPKNKTAKSKKKK